MTKNTAFRMCRGLWLPAMMLLTLSGRFIAGAHAAPPGSGISGSARNITHTEQLLEVNPRFVDGGRHIVYLECTAGEMSFAALRCRLMLADRNGFAVVPLTSMGVVDYAMDEHTGDILVLTSDSAAEEDMAFDFYQRISEWQLWRLNLQTRAMTPVTNADGRPLSDGYSLLGMSALPDYAHNVMTSESPNGRNMIRIMLEFAGEQGQVKFYYAQRGCTQKQILHTGAYATQTHFPWFPDVTWVDENVFLTQTFEGAGDYKFPQTRGGFAIIKVNLKTAAVETISANVGLKPFPRFSLDDSRSWLYFQTESAEGFTELRRLNLADGEADIIYRTEAEIGQARTSPDGASIVFTLGRSNNFDIVRLDLDRNRIQRLARY